MSSEEVSMPVWHEKQLRAATCAAGVAMDAITMDERAYDQWEEHHFRDFLEEYPSCRFGKGQVSFCCYSRNSRRFTRLIFAFYPIAIFIR